MYYNYTKMNSNQKKYNQLLSNKMRSMSAHNSSINEAIKSLLTKTQTYVSNINKNGSVKNETVRTRNATAVLNASKLFLKAKQNKKKTIGEYREKEREMKQGSPFPLLS